MISRLWQNGPAVPLTTPFLSTEGNPVDHAALAKQVVRCAKAGLGIVLLGTTGEGVQWAFLVSGSQNADFVISESFVRQGAQRVRLHRA